MAPRAPDDLYGEVILDHNRNPRNRGEVEDPDVVGRAVNPFCGDEVDLQIALDGVRAVRVGLQAVGCSIIQASGSVLTTAIQDKTLDEIEALSDAFKSLLRGMSPSDEEIRRLGTLGALSIVRDFPIRVKCALLPWSALEEAIETLRKAEP